MADRNYTETDYAWAAGFLDGEGCFCLAKCGPKTHEATRRPIVSVGQIDIRSLEKLADMFGGKVKKNRTNASGKQIYQWQLGSASEIRKMIPSVLPYLINKREEAEIVFAYSVMMYRRGTVPYSNEEIGIRMGLISEYAEIREAA